LELVKVIGKLAGALLLRVIVAVTAVDELPWTEL
jgi:hypothetical protein